MLVGTMRNASLFQCLLSLFLCQLLTAHNHEELTIASAASAVPLPCRSDDAAVDIIRGGGNGIFGDDGIDMKTRDTILRFLDSSFKGADDYPFHIQGMRWHFMSLLRDSRRLERLAKHLSDDDNEGDDDGFVALEQAANYVVNFNMAGFFRVQTKLFVHFLREHLCEEDSIGPFIEGGNAMAETDAFKKLVSQVEEYRVQSQKIGRLLYERAKAASNSSNSLKHKQQLLGDVTRSSRQLLDQLAPLRSLQETLIVPAISRVVPSKVQKSFNNKVLLNLGLLESRLHLVGMHDAVWESGIEDEKKKFVNEIPYVARVMIERWRKSLYIPKAGALDYGYQNSA
mmetsp:Transcript_24417/g.43742  ORF Transcript_24417/g.43742 Transcript_24417/m.43742 type:complete len:341 (-) Transcript_24417:299-1321(-)